MLRRAVFLVLLSWLACGPSSDEAPVSGTGTDVPEARYLVLQKLGSSVAFYSAEGGLLATVPVGKNPHEMILSADGAAAYVTDYGALGVEAEAEGGNTVTVVDLRTRAKAGVVDLGGFHRPHGIDLGKSTGRLLVTTEHPNRLLIVDPKTGKVLQDFDTQGKSSHMVRESPDGKKAFVSNIGTKDVSLIDLETGSVDKAPVGERPEGSDITADGKWLFVACRESNVIAIIDTEQKKMVGQVATGRGPNRVRLTPDGKLLVYSLVHDHQVGIADVETRKQIATIDLDAAPVSLHLSPDGERALTASQGQDKVYVISLAERKILQQFETAEGAGPDPVLEIPMTR